MKKNILILSMLTSILLSEDSVNQNPIPKDNLIMKENEFMI